MDKTVQKLLTGGQKSASSLRMNLDGELVVDIITEKRYLLQEYTNMLNAFKLLLI